jgi:hypothetical protein
LLVAVSTILGSPLTKLATGEKRGWVLCEQNNV